MTAPRFVSLPDVPWFPVEMPDGAELPVYEVGGPAGAPVLLFGHANGCAAGSYGPWLARLAATVRCFAFDARGHGGSRWPDGPIATVFGVDRMADDLAHLTRAVAHRAGVPRIAYCGHSLGGGAALRLAVAGALPDWTATIIFEPPVFPPPESAAYGEAVAKQKRLIEGTAKRRVAWPSPDVLYERLKGRGMFARFDDAMLMAHCRATLRPQPDGGFRLACPPDIESHIFASHRDADTWNRLGSIAAPLDLVGGDPAMPDNDWISLVLPEMAARIVGARLTVVPGTGHMLILEAPALCADLLLARIVAARDMQP